MNQIERLIEVKLAQRTIDGLDRQLFYLNKDANRASKIAADENTDPDVRAGALIALDTLKPRIAALEDRRFQLRQLIDQMDQEAARQATIKVISRSGDRAQIAITYLRDDGKKLSYTRHVKVDGHLFKGLSTLTGKQVTYYPESVANEEAA